MFNLDYDTLPECCWTPKKTRIAQEVVDILIKNSINNIEAKTILAIAAVKVSALKIVNETIDPL